MIEKAGLTMDDVINVQVFCPDPPTYSGKFNAVYRTSASTFLREPSPVQLRSSVEVIFKCRPLQ